MSQNSVLCRICLACNVRMFPIAESPLQLVYQRITNTIINMTDSKPVTACYICYAHLKKCYKLMLMSTKAESMLTSILEIDPVVSKKSVEKLHRTGINLCSYLKTRPVEYFDVSKYCVDPIMVKDEPTDDVDNALVKENSEFLNVEMTRETNCEDAGMMENAAVCRICLAVDVHMFTINGKLQIIYERITGHLLRTADSRPVVACYLCHALLKKCHRLMLKACYTDEWMTVMLKKYSELTPKLVATVDRKSANLQSSLRTRPVECYDSLTSDNPSEGSEAFEVAVKIEVEPDVYVGSPLPEMLSDTENSKAQSDTEGSDSKRGAGHTKRTRKRRAAARAIDDQTPEGGVPTDEPKRVRRKRTKNPEQSNDTPSQEKKDKPRRVYKKRIRAYIHECPVCKRLFNRTNHLNDHMKTHTDDRPYECSICQKKFIQKVNLKNHMMTHTGEKPFECEICHTGFIAKSDFNRHLNTHKEERLFECSICQRRFTQMPYLKAHISTHTSEKPHECHICHRRFSQKPYLKNHLKRHADSDSAELKR